MNKQIFEKMTKLPDEIQNHVAIYYNRIPFKRELLNHCKFHYYFYHKEFQLLMYKIDNLHANSIKYECPNWNDDADYEKEKTDKYYEDIEPYLGFFGY